MPIVDDMVSRGNETEEYDTRFQICFAFDKVGGIVSASSASDGVSFQLGERQTRRLTRQEVYFTGPSVCQSSSSSSLCCFHFHVTPVGKKTEG